MTKKFVIGFVSIFLAASWTLPVAGSVQLPLKFHKQERELSCEAAALAMVLRYHGVEVSEADVIKRMPVDPTVKQGDVWGDPEVGFVGDIDGVMGKTGYGIHWTAVAKWASAWKKAEVMGQGTLKELVSHLNEKRPVIVWGLDGPGRSLKWKTPQGREVSALDNEHTRIVFGYKGKPSKPVSFDIMDPRLGPKEISAAEFLKDWDSFGRKGVVIFR